MNIENGGRTPDPDLESLLPSVGLQGAAERGVIPPETGGTAAFGQLAERLLELFWDSGTACVLLGSLIFSVSGALVKFVGTDVPVFEIVLARSFLSLLAGLGVGRLRGITPLFGKRESWGLLFLRGTIGSASMLCRYAALTRLPLADSVSIFFVGPALTAVLGRVVLGEPAGVHTALGCCASLAGVVVVTQPPFLFGGGAAEWTLARMAGVGFAVGGALLGAVSYVIIRRIGVREKALTVSMWFHVSSLITSLVPLLILRLPSGPVLPRPAAAAALVGVAATSFVAQLSNSRGIQLLNVAIASAINFMQVVYAAVLGFLIFHEPMTWVKAGGAVLIALGIVEVSRDRPSEQGQVSTGREGPAYQPVNMTPQRPPVQQELSFRDMR